MTTEQQGRRQWILWVAILVAVVSLAVTPFGEVFDDVKDSLPWVGAGIIISEIILTAGFAVMASRVGISGFRELVAARNTLRSFDWGTVAASLRESRIFWLGFWLSVVGGAGDGIVLIIGIGGSLPLRSWGLMVLPFMDLGVTYAIRRAVYRAVAD